MHKNECMKAAVFAAPKNIEVQEIKIPIPGDDQILVRLEGCGVCASNEPVWEGRPWFHYPLEPGQPGHEGWGYVEEVGKDVTEFKRGDYVTLLSNHAYAEYDVCRLDEAVKLPDDLNGIPFPGEPLGCAMNVFERSNIQEDQTVAIIGIGFLGAILTKLISRTGAKVIAVSKRPYSLEIALEYGASEIINMDDHWRVIENIKSLTNGNFCDCVIEVTGKQWPLDLAAEITRVRGKLVIAGYHQDGLRQVNMQLWNWRGLDVINAHERETSVYIDGINKAIDAILQGTINPFPLYTHRFSLDGLPKAFDLLRDRTGSFMKGLVLYR